MADLTTDLGTAERKTPGENIVRDLWRLQGRSLLDYCRQFASEKRNPEFLPFDMLEEARDLLNETIGRKPNGHA